MKKVFIYYSLTGNGDAVAEHLQLSGVEVRKVEVRKRLPKVFFFRIMSGGFLAGFNHKSKIKEFNTNLEGYDEIMIGSPIWNGRFSCPINTVLSKLDLKDKNVTFVLYAGSGEGSKALKKINKLYPNARVIFLKEPLHHKEELTKLQS